MRWPHAAPHRRRLRVPCPGSRAPAHLIAHLIAALRYLPFPTDASLLPTDHPPLLPVPGLLVKLTAPFWWHWFSYRTKVLFVGCCFLVNMILTNPGFAFSTLLQVSCCSLV
mgnify:CR=1 FL=1